MFQKLEMLEGKVEVANVDFIFVHGSINRCSQTNNYFYHFPWKLIANLNLKSFFEKLTWINMIYCIQ